MFLKTLEAQGFKSFPDKTVLSFEKGITAVVGPNGSGKSNIADAISWVLGEQSTKQLRGEKMEDVIFNGTATRKAQGLAYVTICFDNTDRTLMCDNDEVYITRKYYRSGESKYEINRNTVRLKDINELFMDTGVGRDGYSMIGQGKISDIVSKRSDERRDMFEEAAGISRFRYRKQEAERKLSGTEENLVRLRDILTELEERVGPLAEQSKKAKKFLEFSEEKKELEIGLWLLKLNKIKETTAEHERKLTLAEAQYNETQLKLQQMAELIEQKTGFSQQITVQIEEIRRSSAAFEEQAAVTDGQVAVAKNTLTHFDENIERLKGEIEQSQQGDLNIDRQLSEVTEQCAELNSQIVKQREMLEQSLLEFEEHISKSTEISQKSEQINKQLGEMQNTISMCEVKAVTSNSAIAEINSRGEAVSGAINEQSKRIAVLEEEISQLDSDLVTCEEKISECQNAIKGNEMLIGAKEKRVDELKKQNDELTLEAQTKKRRAMMLLDMERNLEEFNHSVKAVMRDSNRGTLSGVKGPVSRLIKVEEKYSVAIEIALGSAMQNVVVETENDAKKAIAMLKKSGEGRATFLPLSTVKRRSFDEKGLDNCVGFVGLACDLVSCEKKYDDVVSSLLGAIIVVEDLDCAVSIAKKYSYRFKIVTLDGQVVNKGGSMTGGSLNKTAGILGRSSEIERLNAEAKKLDEEAAGVMRNYSDASKELSARRAELDAAKAELITANEDKIRVLGEIRRVSEQKEAAAVNIANLTTEQNNAAERVSALKNTLNETETEKADITAEIEVLNSKLRQVTGGQDELSRIREELTEKNSAIRLEIVSLEKEKEGKQQIIDSLNARRNDAQGQLTALNNEIARFEAEKDAENKHIDELAESACTLREQAKSFKEQVEDLIARRTEAEAISFKSRNEEKELTLHREELSGEVARLKERSETFVKECDELVTKLYDEYELTRSEAEAMNIKIEQPSEAGKRLAELKGKVRALGSVNVAAIDEYKEISLRYEFLKAQITDVETAKAELLKLIEELTGTMQEMFEQQFNSINGHFSHTFVELFGGGTAQLQLTDPNDVLNSGIEIKVQPPGKNVSSIDQLSGGEKSLVAIAIYFAMMKVSPPPFCMLDEVESALDDVNVDRFAAYLRRMSKNTQFVIVTHRRGSMEEADVLYGVTMQEKGVSKLLQLKINEVEKLIK